MAGGVNGVSAEGERGRVVRRRRTHRDAGAEAGAGLRARSADVVAHSRILVAGRVQVSHRPRTVGAGEAAWPRRVGACTQTQQGGGDGGDSGSETGGKEQPRFSGESCKSKRTHDWIQTQTTVIEPFISFPKAMY